jgi:hypothetical protein
MRQVETNNYGEQFPYREALRERLWGFSGERGKLAVLGMWERVMKMMRKNKGVPLMESPSSASEINMELDNFFEGSF